MIIFLFHNVAWFTSLILYIALFHSFPLNPICHRAGNIDVHMNTRHPSLTEMPHTYHLFSLQSSHCSLYFSLFRSYGSSILDSHGTVSSIMINDLFSVEYNSISGLNRVSLSDGTASLLLISTRNSKSSALFNKPTLCFFSHFPCVPFVLILWTLDQPFHSFGFAFVNLRPFEFYVVDQPIKEPYRDAR